MRPIVTVLLFTFAIPALAAPPSSSSAAKRIAEAEIYFDHDMTSLQLRFTFEEGPDIAGCGYRARKQPERAQRIDWEHVMPAYDFGRALECWQ